MMLSAAAAMKDSTSRKHKRPNGRMTIECVERVNPKIVDHLIQHFMELPVLFQRRYTRDQQHIFMKAYQRKLVDGTVSTTYSQIKGSNGRMFGKHSFQSMERELRHTLARDNYYDLDIVNCHPVLLQHYCRSKDIACQQLDHYITHREECFTHLMKETNCTRDVAKMTYLQVINDGGKKLMRHCKSPQFTAFFEEMGLIRVRIMALEPKLLKQAEKRVNEKKTLNPLRPYSVAGSCVNILLCELENRCLMAMHQLLQSRGVEVGCLVFDGLMIHKPTELVTYDLNELCLAMQAHVQGETGIGVKIEEKPMTQGLSLPQSVFQQPDPPALTNKGEYQTTKERFSRAHHVP
jgi:hypothetical protein